MYNKSKIMKSAWSKFKSGSYATFSKALCQAWREAKRIVEKRLQGYVTAAELHIGDTIEVNTYGGYEDNNFDAVITEIELCDMNGCKEEFIVIYFGEPEHKNNVCMESTEMIKKITQAPAIVSAITGIVAA